VTALTGSKRLLSPFRSPQDVGSSRTATAFFNSLSIEIKLSKLLAPH